MKTKLVFFNQLHFFQENVLGARYGGCLCWGFRVLLWNISSLDQSQHYFKFYLFYVVCFCVSICNIHPSYFNFTMKLCTQSISCHWFDNCKINNTKPIPNLLKAFTDYCKLLYNFIRAWYLVDIFNPTRQQFIWAEIINSSLVEFVNRNANMYLQLISFHTDTTQVIEILPHVRQGPA